MIYFSRTCSRFVNDGSTKSTPHSHRNRRQKFISFVVNRSVYVRVRPLNDEEKVKGGPAWKVEGNGIRLAESTGTEPTPYVLDSVFDGSFSTSKVYEATTRGLIRQVIEGFNSTVFAYGQTSSGKTHTMRGTEDDPGIVPRAVKEIFQLIESLKNREFLLRISYMEVKRKNELTIVYLSVIPRKNGNFETCVLKALCLRL